MIQVYVGGGSNIDRVNNINTGVAALKEQFSNVIVSPVYESRPFGFEGNNFYNFVAGFETGLDIESLCAALRRIERQCGRQRNQARFSSRTLDIDLLLYGDLVSEEKGIPRQDIAKYDFVLKPLADIAPESPHPQTGVPMASMWTVYAETKSILADVELNLND